MLDNNIYFDIALIAQRLWNIRTKFLMVCIGYIIAFVSLSGFLYLSNILLERTPSWVHSDNNFYSLAKLRKDSSLSGVNLNVID